VLRKRYRQHRQHSNLFGASAMAIEGSLIYLCI
jgi:hypothetical protein